MEIYKKELTKSERSLMDFFWNSNTPLTSVNLLKNNASHEWSDNYMHNMLRNLQKKKFIKECGTVRYGTQYARQFIPTFSREEYATQLALGVGIGPKNIAQVTVAMAEQSSSDEEVISVLEDIIDVLKDKQS